MLLQALIRIAGLAAESVRNLEIHHLGLFVGDDESQLPQTFVLFFFFKSLELSPSLGQGHSLDSFEMDAAPPCSPAVVIAMDNFEGNK